ncbi:N-acetylglucosamine kinase [Cohnella sp. JJ-181]|uniref:N-acetylglucosamine kinase n=1 Tax=Cohnella rhizoplanae TaxID=2974897 RepID=UPI0022FF9DBA|nr:BadF/BadG/BcrA/BcrD ATPase family protein [Cohnella sp. JJ-181]CAI6076009.1 N-acetylmuramic acid/N-acetylglucosamine kinase [Cohnella sp. JJ-181]
MTEREASVIPMYGAEPGTGYVIGVDGGNSKTDYFLFDGRGGFVNHINAGTCSHERFANGYAGAYLEMEARIGELLEPCGVTVQEVEAAAFGLAGCDLPSQKEELSRIVDRIGLKRFAVDNDSFLGIKAGTDRGYGICSVNGSGAVTGGISPSGMRLQVGGIGSELAGDEGGGYYLGRKIVRAVYDAFYRMGPPTAMADPVMELLGAPSRERFMAYAAEGAYKRTLPNTELMRVLFAAADAGDAAARSILEHSARQMALSTAGCIDNLDFPADEEIEIVMSGSVWIKAESPLMMQRYMQHVGELTRRRCRFIPLTVPPATGALLWALELAHGRPVDGVTRRKVLQGVDKRLQS